MEKIKNQHPFLEKKDNNRHFENISWASRAYLCGIDEVGRGAFAGPVVAAAVILKLHSDHPLLIDSKILSENKRIEAAEWILHNSWHAYGSATQYEIDTLGIYTATQKAMLRAYYLLVSHPDTPHPSTLLIDAMPLTVASSLPWDLHIESFCYGESRSISIAAASIIAKVFRDKLISEQDKTIYGYNFTSHKGYGTTLHQQILTSSGLSILHRKSFIKDHSKESHHDRDKKNQISLFC